MKKWNNEIDEENERQWINNERKWKWRIMKRNENNEIMNNDEIIMK